MTVNEVMKPALILNGVGIQIHLGEILGHPELVSVDVLRASVASPSQSFEVPVAVLRVLGNEEVVKWLEGG
jgi:hypothetical protein